MIILETLPSPSNLTLDRQLHAHLQETGPKNGRFLPSGTNHFQHISPKSIYSTEITEENFK